MNTIRDVLIIAKKIRLRFSDLVIIIFPFQMKAYHLIYAELIRIKKVYFIS